MNPISRTPSRAAVSAATATVATVALLLGTTPTASAVDQATGTPTTVRAVGTPVRTAAPRDNVRRIGGPAPRVPFVVKGALR